MIINPNSSDQKDGKPPKRYWKATEPFCDLKLSHWVEIFLTLALVFVGVSQLIVYNRQASIMDEQTKISSRQLDAMEIEKRPWIRANVELKELRFTEWAGDKFINTILVFDLKNYGESPAANIVISTLVGPHPGNTERMKLDADQQLMCNQGRTQAVAYPIGGPTIFPTESNPIHGGAGSGGLYKTGEPTIFSVNGCIDYSYGKDRHGETGFRMIIGKIEGNIVVGLPFVEGTPQTIPVTPELFKQGFPIDSKVAIIPPDGLLFRPDEGGNYAK
jgi:hypothetical protein